VKGMYAGLRITLVGTLIGYSHAEALARPMLRGAIHQRRLSKRTQLLVLGEGDRWVYCAVSRARWQAERFNQAGANIRILTFDELLAEHFNACDAAAEKAQAFAERNAARAAAAWESLTKDTSWPDGPNAFPVQL